MIAPLKNYIKTKPRLYDLLNSLRPIDDKLESWIDQYSKAMERPVSFIQVGASDGLRWDPLRRFIVRDRWQGVLIEPLRPVFSMLCDNYAYLDNRGLYFENCAISDKDGSVRFWSFSEAFLDTLSLEKRLFYLRKSSLDKMQVEKQLCETPELLPSVQSYVTPCLRLDDIVSRFFPANEVDLLFVDAEGFDDTVLRTIDLETTKPRAIVYENHNLGARRASLERHLASSGYLLRDFDGDTLAELITARTA
ncbi:MAG: FkbM family methyltransferase [Pseudomonadota bacterium]